MNSATPSSANRRIRVFVSSTFRDMVEERNELMTHAWPELRRFCRERQVELVEVDLRWGIAEEQSTRRETLKLCLDEIRACRPYFIGLLGERYGWVPGDDAFTPDLQDEQPWLRDLHGKSVTELEILHGVLNSPEMAGRAFFYFRDPAYAQTRGADYLSENAAAAGEQTELKTLIKRTCAANTIPLRDKYPDPRQLARFVLEDLRTAIDAEFPISSIPDPLDREARDHEAFAEIRRRTYIGRPDYFSVLDRHAGGDGTPLVVLGDSGSGKSALLANWIDHWRKTHPNDFIFQNYIGSTSDSARHWRLIVRLIAEIKRWTGDREELPRTHDEVLKTFPVWLAKARLKAERAGGNPRPSRWWPFHRAAAVSGLRFIVVLDALNQLEDLDHARLLGWLPSQPFTGPLRLIVSTLPGDTLDMVEKRRWPSLRVEPLTPDERRSVIAGYLQRFGKKLDLDRLQRIASAPTAANALYLKILLDELRVTGTHERLDERLAEYLAAADIPALLRKVLDRYQRDYERDRPGLVGEALGLIWGARRGLTETELLRLLRPKSKTRNSKLETASLPQLPAAIWNPLRAALEEGLVSRGGILNFAHDFLRAAVQAAYVPDRNRQKASRLQLANDFEKQPVTARSCDELPWLLWQASQRKRLRRCLLEIERFLLVRERDQEELMSYWAGVKEERQMGQLYLGSFNEWSSASNREQDQIAYAANRLGYFLNAAGLHAEAEPLYRRALAIVEQSLGGNHPDVAGSLINLGELLHETNRLAEAETLLRKALAIDERRLGPNHPDVAAALDNLAQLLQDTNLMTEGETLYRRALAIYEQSFGPDHPAVARPLNNLAGLLQDINRLAEAEPLYRRALAILEQSFGENHPDVATAINNLALLLKATNRVAEAEPLCRRALAIDERSFGPDHPAVAIRLNNLALVLEGTNRLAEAEPLYRRALAILEQSLGEGHPKVATALDNLAALLKATNRLAEGEPLYRRALAINEHSFAPDHPTVVTSLNNLALALKATNRLAEAEPLYRRALAIAERSFGPDHPTVARALNNLASLLQDTNRLAEAEPLYRRALALCEQHSGENHPNVACVLDNLAQLLGATNRKAKAEPLLRRALAIDEHSFGPHHPTVAIRLNNLAVLLAATNRLAEAEPLLRRHLEIFLIFTRATGHRHPHLEGAVRNYDALLRRMGMTQTQVRRKLEVLLGAYGLGSGND